MLRDSNKFWAFNGKEDYVKTEEMKVDKSLHLGPEVLSLCRLVVILHLRVFHPVSPSLHLMLMLVWTEIILVQEI